MAPGPFSNTECVGPVLAVNGWGDRPSSHRPQRAHSRGERTPFLVPLSVAHVVVFLMAVTSWLLPQTFLPETTDIYDKKNMPRAIYCIHALR